MGMYSELGYVVNAFKKNFTDKREPLVLYGLGAITEGLLESIREYNVIGLMDGKRKSGKQWGVKILDKQDILLRNVRTIIIIAKQPAIPVIFHRIEEFCRTNGIKVYDVNGRCLEDIYYGFENESPYFQVNINDLRREISLHNVISLDIFDTLLVRRIWKPEDVFRYMEMRLEKEGFALNFSFAKVRIQAERNLLQKQLVPNIYEIYEEVQSLTGITAQEKRYFINKEIEIELSMIKPRTAMLKLFKEIKNKKIFLVSDMYLPKEILTFILKRNGYEGYSEIIVSCDHKKVKKQGLFSVLEAKTEKTDHILHIGDDDSADIEPLREKGIDTFFIMSQREMLANSSYGEIIDHTESVIDAILIGKFINHAFDNPFVLYQTKGRLRVNTLELYTTLFLAPVVFAYCAWIVKKTMETGCTYIWYTSRDGYLIQQIIGMMKKEYGEASIPDGNYFYTSRRACLAATVYDYEDIKERLLPHFEGDIYSLFFERFGIKIEEKAKEQRCGDIEKVLWYSRKYAERILAHCERERNNYLSYIKKECGAKDHQRIGIIDLVAKGTVQNELVKLLTDHSLVGMYFFKTNADFAQISPDMEFCSMYQPQGKYSSDCPNVYRSYRQLEFVLTSDEPTFQSMDDQGGKCFMRELRSQKQIEHVRFMQHAIIRYAKSLIKISDFQQIMEISDKIPDMLLGFMDSQYSELAVKELSEMVLYSELENLKFTVTENL